MSCRVPTARLGSPTAAAQTVVFNVKSARSALRFVSMRCLGAAAVGTPEPRGERPCINPWRMLIGAAAPAATGDR